jgi:L-fuculose-phosphate aldolase
MTMHCFESRQQVVTYCRKLADSRLAVGVAGNISCLDRASGLIALSPSAMDYRAITTDDVVLMDGDGQLVDPGRRPTSEWAMHLGCYRQRESIGAVVHTHSPAATTLAVLGRELPAVHYMIALNGADRIPLAPYHRFGSPALAAAAVDAMGDGWACLLQNHGVLATGPDLEAAWDLADTIEFCAELYLRATAVGEPRILSGEQIAEVIEHLGGYRKQR